MRTGGPEDDEGRAKVQLRRSRVQKCKGEQRGTARGRVGTVTRGQGEMHFGARAVGLGTGLGIGIN